jgi:histidinol-phosphate/aromatic aminotransferase/cobyric acid decarboxylase-like protein
LSMKHGGLQQFDFDDKSAFLDLSVNLNPYGPRLNLALTAEELANYPDPNCLGLRRLIARERGRRIEEVLIGNGATELIWAAARAFLKPSHTALVIKPSFSEFQTAVPRTGAELIEFESLEGDDFAIDFDKLDLCLSTVKPKVFSLCNPNSPTGSYLKPEIINCLASRHPETIFLLDESFLSLSVHHQALHAEYRSNVLRIVSLTKDHSIAGIRLGFAMGSEAYLQKMSAEIPNWSVNALAQKTGMKIFEDKTFLDRSREFIFRDKIFVEAAFQERSMRYLSGSTVFCMFKHKEAELSRLMLEDHKILIRSCESYGLKGWYRIAIRPRNDMQRFFTALDAVAARE